MDTGRFDTVATILANTDSRRGVLRTLAGAALGAAGLAALGLDEADARKKRRKKDKGKDRKRRRRAARCPGTGDTNLFVGTATVAQVFEARRGGQLIEAEILVARATGGDRLRLEIRAVNDAGVPTGAVLAATTVEDVPPTTFAAPRKVAARFADRATVEAGARYALAVTAATDDAFALRGRSDGTCGTEHFTETAPGTFTSFPDTLVFAVFVR